MMISHDSGAKTLHLSGRRIQSAQYALTISDGIWQLKGDAQDYQRSEICKEIIEHLKEAGKYGLSAGDIVDLIGKNDDTVRSALRRMVAKGEILQPRKRGDYFFSDDEDDDVQQVGFSIN